MFEGNQGMRVNHVVEIVFLPSSIQRHSYVLRLMIF